LTKITAPIKPEQLTEPSIAVLIKNKENVKAAPNKKQSITAVQEPVMTPPIINSDLVLQKTEVNRTPITPDIENKASQTGTKKQATSNNLIHKIPLAKPEISKAPDLLGHRWEF